MSPLSLNLVSLNEYGRKGNFFIYRNFHSLGFMKAYRSNPFVLCVLTNSTLFHEPTHARTGKGYTRLVIVFFLPVSKS